MAFKIGFTTANRISQILLTLLFVVVALIPTEFFIFMKYTISPNGFWNLAFFVVGLIILGPFQIILAILGIKVISMIWDL